MKKIICLLLVTIMAMALLTGCGGGNEAPKSEPKASNDTPAVEDNYVENTEDEFGLPGGIQTLEIDAWGMDTLRISYDGDTLFGESTGQELMFYDPELGVDLFVYVGEDAQEIINGYSSYDWAENYSATPVSEQTINGMLVRSFTHSYTNDGDFREKTVYTIPVGNGLALNIEGDFEDPSILERAFLSIEGTVLNPLSESDYIIFKDAAGIPVYKFQPIQAAGQLNILSNENARIYFEFTTQKEDGSMLTRPAEIHLNAYGSGQDFFNAISGKYWTTYTPWEETLYHTGESEKYTSMVCFWDTKVNGEIQQYQDCAFYFERPDGNLVTGICDDTQKVFLSALFENGFIPAN